MDGFKALVEAAKKKKHATHPRIGFPGYGYSSVPGDRNQTDRFTPSLGPGPAIPAATPIHQQSADGGVIEMTPGGGDGGAPMMGAPTGDGGAPAAGESIDVSNLDTIIEGLSEDQLNSDTMAEIRKIFESVKNGSGVLYHSCDGVEVLDKEIPPTSDAQVSALAASCEAALNAFKEYTGIDYLTWRTK